jgi:hypothetical protein
MKKLTKTQKGAYPAYIAEFDATSIGEELGYGKLTVKASAFDLLETIARIDRRRREIEEIETQRGNLTGGQTALYLVSLYAQDGEDEETGEPLYGRRLMSRTSGEWHIADGEHFESEDAWNCRYKYYKYKYENGRKGEYLDFFKKVCE